MTKAPRRSPLHDTLSPRTFGWATWHGMPVPLELSDERHAKAIQLTDVSCLSRFGVKGPHAEQWLAAHGVSAPAEANTWMATDSGAIVARLARSEFLVEDRLGGETVDRMGHSLHPGPGLYPVLRQDAAILLAGEQANDLLAQTCSVNFSAWDFEKRAVVMTSMAGVSVLVLWYRLNGRPCYRIWCDGTFGPYLWNTLFEIAQESGGGAVGLRALMVESAAQ